MGLFDKLRSNKTISLTPQAGLLLAAITMVVVDGEVDDDEIAIIRRLDGTNQTADWDSAVSVWKTTSIEDCIPLVSAAMNHDQRLATIANLIDIAMADGILAGAEQNLLEAYVEALEISESEIAPIVNVVAMKNNKSIFQ